MTRKRTAIVLGGSGSVGAALLRELFTDDGFDAVITLSRRSLPEAVAMARNAGRKLVEQLVPDMNPAALAAATIDAVKDQSTASSKGSACSAWAPAPRSSRSRSIAPSTSR
jgi:NAD(P)-dependent dehydrogenase (short-subunit alcohol dehydrogenase family)